MTEPVADPALLMELQTTLETPFSPPGPHKLRQLCRHLLQNPDLISEPDWAPVIRWILLAYHEQPPPQPSDAEQISFLMDHAGLTRSEARKLVAAATGRTPAAVKMAHLRASRRKA